ncbi:MAG: filamentous hemagglutinin N-terminal domain-containing protein [Pseudomonadota bacterium]
MTNAKRRIRRTALCAATAIALIAGLTSDAEAQIVTDGSVGAQRQFSASGDALIGPDLGRRSGGNLIHSFREFNARDGQTVLFGVPSGVSNVIGRVTGPNATTIDGRISFTDDALSGLPVNADFWFFNPNGVMIGAGAELRTGGALYLSAGDGLNFADGSRLSADLGEKLTITSAAPEAFGFFESEPGPLIIRGASIPAQGDGIALSGGVIEIDQSFLFAGPNENLVLIAGAQGDLAPVSADAATPPPTGGTISLTGGGEGLLTADGGIISLSAGTINVSDGAVLSQALSGTGSDLRVRADQLTLSDDGVIGTITLGAFDAGDIIVTARDIQLLRGGAIRSQTSAAGNAGEIRVSGFETLRISRDGSGKETVIESEVSAPPPQENADDVVIPASGDAGLVSITGGDLIMEDGGRIFSSTLGDGDAGSSIIRVSTLSAFDGAQIGTGALDAPDATVPTTGAGGDLDVEASERMLFSGVLSETANFPEPEPSGLFSGTEGAETGRGGDVKASAPLIILTNEAEIGSETFAASRAGRVDLSGGDLIVEDGAEVTTTSRAGGRAGTVRIEMTGDVTIRDRGDVASRAGGVDGRAGRVVIFGRDVMVEDSATVATNSLSSDGGAVRITGRRTTVINGAEVTTSVGDDDGDGGAIRVFGGPLALLNEARLASSAEQGDGGVVEISAVTSFIEPTSEIDVSSALGSAGEIRFLGAINDSTAETEAPDAEFFNRFALIDDFCVAAVTGGSALRLRPPAAAPFDAGATPALFGGAIPYPASGVASSGLAPEREYEMRLAALPDPGCAGMW